MNKEELIEWLQINLDDKEDLFYFGFTRHIKGTVSIEIEGLLKSARLYRFGKYVQTKLDSLLGE